MEDNLRFRAWDEHTKTMHYSDNYPTYTTEDIPAISVFFKHAIQKRWIIMQSTGLPCKEGKGIYVGDILSSPRYEYKYIVEFTQKFAEYRALATKRTAMLPASDFFTLRIIGNIYEHPSILTP